MSILYAAIANIDSVVCHHQTGFNEYKDKVQEYLTLNNKEQEICYAVKGAIFHAYTSNGLSYIAVTEPQASRQVALYFLRQLCAAFSNNAELVSRAKVGQTECLQLIYNAELASHMSKFAQMAATGPSQINQLDTQVSEVTNVMRSNIKTMMERETKLDDLVSQTNDLQQSAGMFHTTARRVKQKTWLQNLKMKLCLGGTVIIVVIIIILIILWQTGVFNAKPATSTTVQPTTKV